METILAIYLLTTLPGLVAIATVAANEIRKNK